MARADTRTLLPLDSFFRQVGISPLHANGVYFNGESESPGCGNLLPQYSWQNADMVGREDLAIAIRAAEDAIAAVTGYPVAPDWQVDERRSFDRPFNRAVWATDMRNVRGAGRSITSRYGYVISGGVKAKTLIEADSAITYSDEDGDGYDETATVTTNTSVTDINEIAVFFPDQDGADDWEVRPLKRVTIDSDAGTATIIFRREQVPEPSQWEALALPVGGIDGSVDANFLEAVDVYRVYNDPSTQAALLWEPWDRCSCSGSGCDLCTFDSQTACLQARDPRLGILIPTPATWDSDAAAFTTGSACIGRMPDQVRLWYRAGWRDMRRARPMVDMDPHFAWMVSVLACTYLDRPICGCDTVKQFIDRWREDLSANSGKENSADSYQTATAQLTCPLGTMRGAWEVWRRLNQGGFILGRSVG